MLMFLLLYIQLLTKLLYIHGLCVQRMLPSESQGQTVASFEIVVML